MKLIGNANATCPNCGQHLDRMPGRKTKCPHCQHFMFVRTRPSDKQRVLVTEEEAEQIEELWSIENGTHSTYLARKKRVSEEKARLAKRFGREPSDNEVSWSILNQDMIEHANQHNWGFFRIAKFEMAEILRKESLLDRALGAYLELCYIDLNGPCNSGGVPEELLKEYPPWDTKHLGELAPGILKLISKIIKETKTSRSDVQALFFDRANNVKDSLRLTVDVTKAWRQVQKALF